ncbi:uncharacterized protein LOC135807129 [Sycon ciliatum]|uniref:uncharacterized protein LOC135807129 n=1 Tax=Sycon ciliatum TaxID=27933 RepID=UPI0031F65936
MELKLPSDKIKKIKSEAKSLLQADALTALAVSRFLGKLNHAAQAIAAAPLFYRHLQRCLQVSLEEGNQEYSHPCHLSPDAREELTWWTDHLSHKNGKQLLLAKPDMVIETDASTIGWGASFNNVRTGGPWSPQERHMHINCLELLAASLAIKSYAKDATDVVIHLKMDNTTALTYINKLGGTVSPELNRLTKELWVWCFQRNITLKASHLAGSLNVIADEESRVMKDRSDWMLCPKIFQRINSRFGPLDVDLFASRLSHQLPQYVSWRPDPVAIATDAFTMNWKVSNGYANPPWNLIGKVLQQVQQQNAEIVLVAPDYESRTLANRADDEKQAQLLIATIQPYKAVSSSTVARWIKTVLAKAGIDTDIFKAHSVRSAATSAAADAGVTTTDILSAADWSSESIFQKFYYKPQKNNIFGKAVLSTKLSTTDKLQNHVDMETEHSEI